MTKLLTTNNTELVSRNVAIETRHSELEESLDWERLKEAIIAIFQGIPEKFASWRPGYDPPHKCIWEECRKKGIKKITINTLTEEKFKKKEEILVESFSPKYYGDKVVVEHRMFKVEYKFPKERKLILKRIILK